MRSKADISQLNLPHGSENENVRCVGWLYRCAFRKLTGLVGVE